LLPDMAARLAQFGWHAQFQMDRRFFHEREDLLRPLPCTLVCEHIGKFLEARSSRLSRVSFATRTCR
jgi:D-galactarolactone isomerase